MLLLVLPGPGLPQLATPRRAYTFKGGIEVIRVSLSVTDTRRHFVSGLEQSDFVVFEDGVRQELSYFSPEPLPLSVSLLVDCSASMDREGKLPLAQQAGVRFVEQLRPEDVAQVVQFNDRLQVLQDFTSDRAALSAALRGTRAGGATGLFNALYVTLKQLRKQGDPDAPRRRAIVLLSDGEDTTSLVAEDQVTELARQSDVAVYAISLQSPLVSERQKRRSGLASYFLGTLTRESGGELYAPKAASELDSVYGRVAEELRAQYTLGYVSRDERRDGRWRQIMVRTPSRGNLLLRHKPGYYAFRG